MPEPYKPVPPFEIYNGTMDIADKNGHLCTADDPEIAEAILAALNEKFGAPSTQVK